MHDYELLVIGAGPGGYVAALKASKLGLHVAVVESREAGGTCLNRGCVPTKAMLHSSSLYRELQHCQEMGVYAESPRVDINAIYLRKQAISAKLSAGIEAMFRAAKIDLIQGTGTIMGSHQVLITQEEQTRTLTADSILIATGSIPARPPIPGLDLPGVMTSDELLAGEGRLYDSLVIIGGGVIGVEFATFYSDLGCQVTIVEGLDRLLPIMDKEIGQNLTQILKKRGVKIHTKAMVKSITETEEGLSVSFTNAKGGEVSVAGQAVLCAIGRWPNTAGLFGPGLSIEMDGRRIRVDGSFQTSIPHVYAIGDVSSPIQLAHVASAQGTACVEMLCGRTSQEDLTLVPSCVYCNPEIACVGMTEQEAAAAGIPAVAKKAVMFSNARTMIEDGERSFMKIVARKDDRRIIGAQLMCPRSTDMISQIAQAIANRMTVEDLLKAMRPHPTFEEVLGEVLESLADGL